MSIYLSRLVLNPRSRQVWSELRDPYQIHRTLSKAFGDDSQKYKGARVLFRVDSSQDSDLWLLVQSVVEPDWRPVEQVPGYLIGQVQVKRIEPSLRVGQRLIFRLRANPTVRRDGKRLGIYKDDEQEDWLRRKASEHGFGVLSYIAKREQAVQSTTQNGRGKFAAVTFDGVLKVTDPDKFLIALRSGVGSAKAFGFGLLSIAPVR